MIILKSFWLYWYQASNFEAAGTVAKIGSCLKLKHHSKFSLQNRWNTLYETKGQFHQTLYVINIALIVAQYSEKGLQLSIERSIMFVQFLCYFSNTDRQKWCNLEGQNLICQVLVNLVPNMKKCRV
jgi:hypothetical protein